jgi:hypothetical protein
MIPVRAYVRYVEYITRDDDGNGGGFLGIYESDNPYVGTHMENYRRQYNMDPGAKIYDSIPSGKTDDGKDDKQLVETWYVDSIFIVPNEDGSCPGELGTVFEGSFAFSSTSISAYNRFDKRLRDMKYNVNKGGKIVPSEVVPWAHIWHLKTMLHPKSTPQRSWMTPVLTWAAKDEKGTELPYRSSRMPKDEVLYQQAQRLFNELREGNVVHNYDKDTGGADGTMATDANYTGGTGSDDAPFPKI